MDPQEIPISIPVFRPEKDVPYDVWRHKFLLLLESMNCLENVKNQTRPSEVKEEDWKRMEVRAIMMFSAAVETALIIQCETAYEIMSKLDNLYMGKSEDQQAFIEKKISQLRVDDCAGPDKDIGLKSDEKEEKQLSETNTKETCDPCSSDDTDEDRGTKKKKASVSKIG
jgi:hypothetical protein